MVRNICKSPTFYERGMGVPQFTIGFPNWPIWADLGTYIFLKPYFGMFGDVYQTLRWQYDNMIWLKQPSLQFTGLSEYSGKTLGWKCRSPGGYLPELRICNMKERHKKYEQQWRPQRYLRTHTHASRLQKTSKNDVYIYCTSIARMDQSCGSVHENPSGPSKL